MLLCKIFFSLAEPVHFRSAQLRAPAPDPGVKELFKNCFKIFDALKQVLYVMGIFFRLDLSNIAKKVTIFLHIFGPYSLREL